MERIFSSCCLHPVLGIRDGYSRCSWSAFEIVSTSRLSTRVYHRKPPKNLRYPRRTKLPPDLEVNTFLKKKPSPLMDPSTDGDLVVDDAREKHLVVDGFETDDEDDEGEQWKEEEKEGEGDGILWETDEIEAISSLFKGRVPQKPGKLDRQRPLPLPVPYKTRPVGLPSPKNRARTSFAANVSRQSLLKQVYKNPRFLIGLAKEIKALPPGKDVSVVLDKWVQFLRKGSLSLTIRELGHMGLPEKALQIYTWAQKQSHLFPDDRILASTVEVLATSRELKMPNLKNFLSLASQSVYEAVVRGFIRSGSLIRAYDLVSVARKGIGMLDSSIYSKLISELAKNPDNRVLVLALLKELGEREDLNLLQGDCTSIMKVCIRLGKYETVEGLFNWYKQSGRDPSVVMYTTLIHSRYSSQCYREAVAVVWEMEKSNCLFTLATYRVVIKLFVAMNDLSRTTRYFSKLKEAGFSPSFDIYRDVLKVYMFHGRLAKCKEVCTEAEMAGFKFDEQIKNLFMQYER